MKYLFRFIILFIVFGFTIENKNDNHSYYVPFNYYNQIVKGDSSHVELLGHVHYIHKFHKEKEIYLASCLRELYGGNVSYYKNCNKFKDSTVYYFGKLFFREIDNQFWNDSNKIYLVEYKFDSKHLKLVSEKNKQKKVIWFKYIGNQRPDWICKKL